MQADPEAVAKAADWPVSEVDLSARHLWLVQHRAAITERLQVDPHFYDATLAGWWCWGLCCWIGTGWCSGEGPWSSEDGATWTGNAGRGIHRQLPHLGNAGMGIHRKLPHLGDAGRGILTWMEALRDRLRRVRICCGDWARVVTPSVTDRHGLTGVLLDPPYHDGHDAEEGLYAAGGGADVWAAAAAWAVEAGERPTMRIVLCGYDGAWTPPKGWTETTFTARKGYANNGNERRERLWLSPHCVRPSQLSLLGGRDA